MSTNASENNQYEHVAVGVGTVFDEKNTPLASDLQKAGVHHFTTGARQTVIAYRVLGCIHHAGMREYVASPIFNGKVDHIVS